ncbi:uncharacterized protein [Leptinotarsa decemlineata]|uniref:uncharacterized protein n=1 Tax=Leptinotarsa decemlineata TaxID=7539 RepID=UPI003D307DB3
MYKILPLSLGPGLYYEKIGTPNLYNDDWKMIIYLDLYDYYLPNTVHFMNRTNTYFDNFDTKINRIVKSVNDLNENISNFEIKDHLTLEVNELVSIFDLILTRFKLNQNNLVEMISFTQRGILHPLVMSPMKSIHEASKIQNYISDFTFPVTPVIEYMHILFNLITTNIVFIDKKSTFVLYIPLIEKRDYDVFKMSSFPVPSTNNAFGFILPQESFFVTDFSKQYFFSMNDFELFSCKHVLADRYICKQNKPIYLAHLHKGCESNLCMPTTSIPDSCDRRIIHIKETLFIQLANKNSWLFVSPHKEYVDLKCRSIEGRQTITLNDTGVLSISSNCSVYSKSVILTPHEEFSSEVITHYIAPLNLKKEINSNLSNFVLSKIKPIETPLVINSKNYHDLKEISHNFQKLQENENESLSTVNRTDLVHHGILYFIVCLLFCLLIFYILRTLHKRYKSESNVSLHSANEIDVTGGAQKTEEIKNQLDHIALKGSSKASRGSENCTLPRYNFQN